MRTTMPVLLVLALGTSAMMLGMSGFEDAWGASGPQVEGASGAVNDTGGEVDPQNGAVNGSVRSDEGSTIGLIVNGLQSLTNIAGSVVVLPVTLMQLGFPAWFAVPLGSVATVIVGIGLVEFATQRDW